MHGGSILSWPKPCDSLADCEASSDAFRKVVWTAGPQNSLWGWRKERTHRLPLPIHLLPSGCCPHGVFKLSVSKMSPSLLWSNGLFLLARLYGQCGFSNLLTTAGTEQVIAGAAPAKRLRVVLIWQIQKLSLHQPGGWACLGLNKVNELDKRHQLCTNTRYNDLKNPPCYSFQIYVLVFLFIRKFFIVAAKISTFP